MSYQKGVLGAIGAVAVFLVQLILAPNLAVGSVIPNFMVAFALAYCLSRPQTFSPVLAFVLGLAFDFVSGAPVGAMAFSLTLFAYAGSRAIELLDNDGLAAPVMLLVVLSLLVNVAFGIFVLASGYEASFWSVFVHIVLPGALYNAVLAIAAYALAGKLFPQPKAMGPTSVSNVR